MEVGAEETTGIGGGSPTGNMGKGGGKASAGDVEEEGRATSPNSAGGATLLGVVEGGAKDGSTDTAALVLGIAAVEVVSSKTGIAGVRVLRFPLGTCGIVVLVELLLLGGCKSGSATAGFLRDSAAGLGIWITEEPPVPAALSPRLSALLAAR